MKIRSVDGVKSTLIDNKKPAEEASISFVDVFTQKNNDSNHKRQQKLFDEIEDQGKILAESCNIEDLKKYKKLVKEFMQEALDKGLELHQSRGYSRGGRMKLFKTVKLVDEKLYQLTDKLLHSKEKGLNVLKAIGEIKGLLMDIYT